MPKVKQVGGRGYYHNPHPFNEWDSNTFCDVTGFRVKVSETMRRWEGYYVIAEAWHPRQPQDFPVVPIKQRIYPTSRRDNVQGDTDIGSFSEGFSEAFDIGGLEII